MSAQTNYRITFEQAVSYIQAYVDKFQLDNNEPGLMNSIGGTMKVDRIKAQIAYILSQRFPSEDNSKLLDTFKTYEGLMCWFCYAEAQGDTKEYAFLSIEANDTVDLESETPLVIPDNGTLTRPFDVIIYDKNQHSNIKSWLMSNRPLVSQFQNYISRGKTDTEGAHKGINQFKSKIVKFEPSNVKKPYGLFENECSQDVADFLANPELKYIRYYFGYNPNNEENKIRIILFGVDEEGNNLIPAEINTESLLSSSGALLNSPSILECSWPPVE